MSTITSPRPSAPSISITSTPTTSRTTSPAPTTRRANRSALRDYYNLKAAAPASPSPTSHEPPKSPLDEDGFDADAYIKSVLANTGLEGVLRVESGLINEIKGLDGERKALVYDNYSKLITATDTIRRMRANMDPLTPTTGTLGMAVGYIAEAAGGLAQSAKGREEEDGGGAAEEGREKREKKRRQRETVRWVLGTPRRLGVLLDKGETEDAQMDWGEVKEILKKWKEVDGVSDLRNECERVMGRA